MGSSGSLHNFKIHNFTSVHIFVLRHILILINASKHRAIRLEIIAPARPVRIDKVIRSSR